MNLLHITDIKKGRVQVAWRGKDNVERPYKNPIPFADPLSAKDRVELRWYLEDYLQFPYGAERNRAEKVEKRMAEWGGSLFKQVFIKGDPDPDPRAFYQEAVREGLEQCEICITSEDPVFLNIPWELMRDPTPGRGYLALSLAGFYRRHTAHRIEEMPELSPNEPFRILLVIARPDDQPEILFGTDARPMLEMLRPLKPRIQMEVLRPPTFDELVRRLNAQRGVYQLVHFDGHGIAESDEGYLAFEKEDSTTDAISSRHLGQTLATCKVPLFVLNACQSAKEGETSAFSSVASQLVAVGAKGVVAMSHSVYVTAAERFIQRFYESLLGHCSLSEAVAAARLKLYADPHRQSVIGPLELRDWIVPALYQQEYRYVPIPEGAGTAVAEEKEDEIALRRRAEEACPEGQFGFIGRDYCILDIERKLRDDDRPWVLLSGIGGTGKTEMAFGFARWFAETGGCPGGVFMASFREKADFGQVKGSIAGYGTDLSRYSEEQQWDMLVGYVREKPCLLIWDNFEPVAGYPVGAEPLASEEERDKLSRFLKAIRGGRSRVIITTRKQDEKWLGIAYKLVELKGLTERDAGGMARVILDTVGRKPEEFRDDPDYSTLIRLLNGHPRSLEVALPNLRRRSPSEIIQALQHRVDSLGEAMEDASLAYAFGQMSDRVQKHLPFIGLFASSVHEVTLGDFTASGTECGQVYEDLVGEALNAAGWEAVLDEAGRGGLLRPIGGRIYELHPTLPTYLRRELKSRVSEDGLKRLDAEFMKFYGIWAFIHLEYLRKSDQITVAAVNFEEANLLRSLRLAEMSGDWGIADPILRLLSEFYEARARMVEWEALRRRLLRSVGREMSPNNDRVRADLWMYLLSNEARYAFLHGDLGIAEATYRRILDYTFSLNDPSVEPAIATVYHQLGAIANEQEQLDQAEELYRNALEIKERLGLEKDAADTLYQLGGIAQKRMQFHQAEELCRKTLEIYERLGLEREAADNYHQLGTIAQERNRYDQAKQWYRKSLEIKERLGLEQRAVSDYYHLGMIARERGQSDQAEEWYRKSLEICERLGLLQGTVYGYHQLGMIAQKRNDFDGAESWYRKALEIRERLGLERDAADDYHQLGVIAQERNDFDGAEEWYGKALEIYERLGRPPLMVNSLAQFGVLRRKQERLKEAVAYLGRALAITTKYNMQIGGTILIMLARVLKAMGEEEFTAAWREAFGGQEPPIEAIREFMKEE